MACGCSGRSPAGRHRLLRRAGLLCALAMLGVAAYGAGIYQGYRVTWPVPQIKALVEQRVRRNGPQIDALGRLVAFPGKQAVPCPPQDAETAVLLLAGQSNAANFQGQRYQGEGGHVINLFDGRCYLAASPLLGAGGRFGESWTLLGNRLVAAGLYRTVILIPVAIGGSAIRQWAAGGALNRMLLAVLRQVAPRYRITAILWQQGAADFALGTSGPRYAADLRSLLASLRAAGVTAPFYLCRASFQLGAAWSPDNPVALAQAALVDGRSIRAGPDTDRDITAFDRYDGLHFSASGEEKFAAAWLALLRAQKAADGTPHAGP